MGKFNPSKIPGWLEPAVGGTMLKTVCPCLFDEQSGKLVEMSPFKDSSSDNGDQAPETMADKAKGWLSKAAAPIATFQAQRAEAAAHAERVDKLKAGTSMQLLPTGRGAPQPVRIAVSSDGAMVTWQSISGPTVSGVLALSAVREVKPVTAQGILRSGGPVPLQFQLVADDQTVKLEASSETEKDEWMNTLEVRAGGRAGLGAGGVARAGGVALAGGVARAGGVWRERAVCGESEQCGASGRFGASACVRRLRRRRARGRRTPRLGARWRTPPSGGSGWSKSSGRRSDAKRRSSRHALRVG